MKKPDYAQCAIPGCQAYALFGHPWCRICGESYCYDHVEDISTHICYTDPPQEYIYPYKSVVEEEIAEILEVIDFEKVMEEVETLRPPHKCISIDKFDSPYHVNPLNGSFNFHLLIEFEDGMNWMMRIRRKQSRSQPEAAIEMCHRSEIATMKAMWDSGVKIPKRYERPKDSQVSSELIYFYQDFVEGGHTTLAFRMDGPVYGYKPIAKAFMLSYAAWMISFEKTTFDKVGSLALDENGLVVVGPHIERDRTASLEPPYFAGPFNTAKERWLSTIDWKMKSILDKKECPPSEELLRYLIMLEMKDLVSDCEELEKGPWYIRHYDLHGRQFKIDKDTGEMYALLDWEWSSLSCKGEAFTPPELFRLSPDRYENDLGDKEALLVDCYRELGRPDLADLVMGSRKYHWLQNIVLRSYDNLEALNGARNAFTSRLEGLDNQPQTLEEWTELMLKRYREDKVVKLLVARQIEGGPPDVRNITERKKKKECGVDKETEHISVEVVETAL
ncbi:hypothetical protein V866_005972 [Kwoniella sp. B9012]